jgi:hypothetical protein
MALFPPNLRKLFPPNLSPFGETYPSRGNPPALAIDGRTAALRLLREYVTELTFYRANQTGLPPIPFQIKPENFHIEWPDTEHELKMPSAVVMQSRGIYDVIGLVGYIQEETRDVFAPGTVVQWQAEYVETVNLEIRASTRAERRAIVAGLEIAISPTEQMSGIRFIMPAYFNQLVCFTLNKRENMDTSDAARYRRAVQLEIEMRFNIVALVNYAPLQPIVKTNTDVDQDTLLPVDLSVGPDPHYPQPGS